MHTLKRTLIAAAVTLAANTFASGAQFDSAATKKPVVKDSLRYARITITGSTKDLPMDTVSKYLLDEPFHAAIGTILPDGWKAQLRQDASVPPSVSTYQDEHWLDAIDRIAMLNDLSVLIDTKRKLVRFSPAMKFAKPKGGVPLVGETVVRTTGYVLPAGDVMDALQAIADRYGFTVEGSQVLSIGVLPIKVAGETLVDDLRGLLVALKHRAALAVEVNQDLGLLSVAAGKEGRSTLAVVHESKALLPKPVAPAVEPKRQSTWSEDWVTYDPPAAAAALATPAAPAASPETSAPLAASLVREMIPLSTPDRIVPTALPATFKVPEGTDSLREVLSAWARQNQYMLVWSMKDDLTVSDAFEFAGRFEDLLSVLEAATADTATPLKVEVNGRVVVITKKNMPVVEPDAGVALKPKATAHKPLKLRHKMAPKATEADPEASEANPTQLDVEH